MAATWRIVEFLRSVSLHNCKTSNIIDVTPGMFQVSLRSMLLIYVK